MPRGNLSDSLLFWPCCIRFPHLSPEKYGLFCVMHRTGYLSNIQSLHLLYTGLIIGGVRLSQGHSLTTIVLKIYVSKQNF